KLCHLSDKVLGRLWKKSAKRLPVSMVKPKIPHVASVAAELLIGTLPNLDHLHPAFVSKLGNKVKRNTNPVRNRLILVIDHLLQIIDHIAFLDPDLVMIRLEPLRDAFRGLEFVQMRVIAETDGERLHRM